jgi:type VI secretion system secreted protein Hcp
LPLDASQWPIKGQSQANFASTPHVVIGFAFPSELYSCQAYKWQDRQHHGSATHYSGGNNGDRDAYLQFGDIKGDSTDDKHKGWIEVKNVDWGVTQPRATAVSTAGGHTSGKAEVHEVSFDKLADIASPVLFQTCAMGKTLPKAKFEFFRADGDGSRVKYFDIELENVMIATVSPNSGDGGLIKEKVNLASSKIKVTYTQQRIGGGAGGSTAGGWDSAANKPYA